MRYQKREGSYQMQASDEFIKKIHESSAWMDGNGYLHAKPKDKEEDNKEHIYQIIPGPNKWDNPTIKRIE